LSQPDPGGNVAHLRRDWDGVAAVIAALVGLLALCVSSYTAYMQRQQVRAQVWTQLIFANSDVDKSLLVVNKGTGPARLESLRLYVDGKAQADWDKVLAALGVKLQNDLSQSTINGNVIAANERLNYMTLKDEDWSKFRAQSKRLRLRACYCSVLDECRVFDNRVARKEDADVAVASCKPSTDEEFSD
jgi:hypothetical protein